MRLKPTSASPPGAVVRRASPVCLSLIVTALLLLAPSPVAASSREHQLKAAVVYNFTKFVAWPRDAFKTPDTPFVIGTLGDGPVVDELVRAVDGRFVGAHPCVVRKVSTIAEAGSVHLLFVGDSNAETTAPLLAELADAPVLLVGDTPAFLDLGGTIQLLVTNDKVAFDIDVSRAHRSRLQVSAQLQKLARMVRREH